MALQSAMPDSELWDGEMRGLVVAGRKVLLLRVRGEIHAYEDRCRHLGVALSEGALADCVLTCSAHLYTYDATTGAGINPKTTQLRAFEVVVRDGAIYVDVEDRRG
jgi:toluene monooxygenase system ferredoxin subunit